MKAKKPEHPAYVAMLAESVRLGFPKRFKPDLTKHDRAWLKTRDHGAPFLWHLRESGTHTVGLTWKGELDGNRNATAVSWPKMLAGTFSEEIGHFYLWNGVALVSYPSSAACQAAIEDWIETERLRCPGCRAFIRTEAETEKGWLCPNCAESRPTEDVYRTHYDDDRGLV